jgi:hypothetical protein
MTVLFVLLPLLLLLLVVGVFVQSAAPLTGSGLAWQCQLCSGRCSIHQSSDFSAHSCLLVEASFL